MNAAHPQPLAIAVLRALGVGATTLAVAASVPALAQQAQKIEKIEVTGSNIKRIEGETALPVTVISRQDIERMGAVTTEDILKRITSSTAMYSDSTQGVGYAVSNANLRGIGASSTLVLLNGRRLANHAFGSVGGFNASANAVDLNSIPFSAIERVEVLRDGASAVYGTDAVGGVINFITRTDYRGGEASLMYGRPQDHIGGRESGVTVALGAGDLEQRLGIPFDTGIAHADAPDGAHGDRCKDRALARRLQDHARLPQVPGTNPSKII